VATWNIRRGGLRRRVSLARALARSDPTWWSSRRPRSWRRRRHGEAPGRPWSWGVPYGRWRCSPVRAWARPRRTGTSCGLAGRLPRSGSASRPCGCSASTSSAGCRASRSAGASPRSNASSPLAGPAARPRSHDDRRRPQRDRPGRAAVACRGCRCGSGSCCASTARHRDGGVEKVLAAGYTDAFRHRKPDQAGSDDAGDGPQRPARLPDAGAGAGGWHRGVRIRTSIRRCSRRPPITSGGDGAGDRGRLRRGCFPGADVPAAAVPARSHFGRNGFGSSPEALRDVSRSCQERGALERVDRVP